MSTPFSIRSELVAAIRRTNRRYRELPEEIRPEVHWDAADEVLEAALKASSHRQALDAIKAWENHWIGLFEGVSR